MEDFNPRYHLDSEQDHHLQGDAIAPLLQKRDKIDAKLARIYDGPGHRVLRAILAMYYETKVEAINRKLRAASEAARSFRR